MKKVNILLLLLVFFCRGFSVDAQVITDGSVKVLQTEVSLARHSAVRCSAQMISGFGGLDASNSVWQVSADDNLTDANCYTYTNWQDIKSGYIVMEGDFFFEDGVKQFMLATTGHLPVSPHLIAGTHYASNQWCRFTFIFDGAANTIDTYCNDELVESGYSTVLGSNSNYSALRMLYYAAPSAKSYVANWKMYQTDSEPIVDNDLYIEGAMSQTAVTVGVGALVSTTFTVSDKDAVVTVYSDNTYSQIRDNTEPLEANNIIVLKKNERIRTYAVEIDDGSETESEIYDGNIKFNMATTATESGLFGKTADDISCKITASGSAPCFSSFTWLDDEFDGVVRADVNIEPGNMEKIYIGTNVHMPISEPLRLKSGRWNKVTVVYDTSTYDDATGIGKADTYVNGVKQCTVETKFTNLWQLRIIMIGRNGSCAYADDFRFLTYRYNEPTIPSCAQLTGDFQVINDTVRIDDGVKVSSLATDKNAGIMVYGDASFERRLASDELLQAGNVIVLCTPDLVYTYYTVTDGSKKVLRDLSDNSSSFSLVRGMAETADGIGGKAKGDKSVKIIVNDKDEKSFNAYNDFTWTHDGYTGFLTAEFNVMTSGATPALSTNGHSGFAPAITGLNAGRWNKVVVIYDAASYNGTSGKTYLYVNGAYSGLADTGFKSGSVIRLIAYGGANGDAMYIDDFKIYESATMPVVTMPDVGAYYRVDDGKINVSGDMTPSAFKADKLNLRVYSDGTFSHLLNADEKITDGNIIVAEDLDKALSYYDVVCDASRRTLATATDAKFDGGMSVIDADVETVGGFAGKDGTDESAMLTVTGKSDCYVRYIDNGFTDKNYIAYEISAYPQSDGRIYFATNDHSALSKQVTIGTECIMNQWNRFVLLINREESTAALYVNGNLVELKSGVEFPTAEKNNLRFVYKAASGSKICVDDAVVYETDMKPNVTKAAVLSQSTEYILFNRELYLPSDVRYSALGDLLGVGRGVSVGFVKDGVRVTPNNGIVPDGTVMTLKNSDVLTTYDIHVTHDNSPFAYGEAISDGKLTDGLLTAVVQINSAEPNDKITVAAYKDGKLVKISQPPMQKNGRYAFFNIEANTTEYDSIKLFLWKGVSLFPLGSNYTVSK